MERTENVCEDMLSVDEFLESIHKELFAEWADNIPVSDAKYKVQLLYVSKLVKLLDRSEKDNFVEIIGFHYAGFE